MNSKRDMRWTLIKAQLEEIGVSMASLSLANGFDPSCLSKVKTIPIPRAQLVIASTLNKTPQTIWPSRYDGKGKPVCRLDWLKANTKENTRLVQKSEAA